MYRLMQPEDKPAVLALWQSQRNESEEFAKKAIERWQFLSRCRAAPAPIYMACAAREA